MPRCTPRLCLLMLFFARLYAQQPDAAPLTDRERMLLDRIDKLEQRVAALESKLSASEPQPAPENTTVAAANAAPVAASSPAATQNTLTFADGTTLNFNLDGYYGYNFNHPIGRANVLRANDALADNFTLNQADVIFERAPDASAGRRFGLRLDLMFGEQTDVYQGSILNEPRPEIYRNIFQAYGSYVFPVGSGLQVDFGKFASPIGFEGNYTKDQLNYSRSFWFNFLPGYHMGMRANYNFNSKFSAQYWLVNGVDQTESFNGFKSQAAILIYKPNNNISWQTNYFEGQQQRDTVAEHWLRSCRVRRLSAFRECAWL